MAFCDWQTLISFEFRLTLFLLYTKITIDYINNYKKCIYRIIDIQVILIYRRDSNIKSLIQQQNILLIELTRIQIQVCNLIMNLWCLDLAFICRSNCGMVHYLLPKHTHTKWESDGYKKDKLADTLVFDGSNWSSVIHSNIIEAWKAPHFTNPTQQKKKKKLRSPESNH